MVPAKAFFKNCADSFRLCENLGPEEPILLDEEEEQEDEEPLLSGSGEFQRSYSDSEMSSWTDVLQKWKDLDHRPSKLLQSVRKVG